MHISNSKFSMQNKEQITDNIREKALQMLRDKYFICGRNGRSVSGETHLLVDLMIRFLAEVQPAELERLSSAEKVWYETTDLLNNQIKELNKSVAHWQKNFMAIMQEIGEKEVLAEAFDKVQKLFNAYSWIPEGRGPYPYDDESYQKEVRNLLDSFKDIRDETWRNIRTKTFEYREKLIAQYESALKKEVQEWREWHKEFDAVCFSEKPTLEDILVVAKKMRYGHPFPADNSKSIAEKLIWGNS